MGPLAGVKVIEIKGIGPGPFAGMLLADMGAEVIVVERSSKGSGTVALPAAMDCNSRGKKSIALNLKTAAGAETLLRLVETADMLFEGFRPGVAERLGFGPEQCHARNPRLVYGRITGWGQTGPLAKTAGHDINYISLTGSLAAIGNPDKPTVPLNLVGDYAGGSMYLVMGMLAALYEAQRSGKGDVIDAAITDGSASLMSMFHSMDKLGAWIPERGSNMLDGHAPFYDTYETSDGRFVSIGSIEPQFYALLVEKTGVDPDAFANPYDKSQWPKMKERLIEVFKTKSQAQWCELMEGTDLCFAPVLNYREAPAHPHNAARNTYIDIDGLTQPAPAPRFARSDCATPSSPSSEGSDTHEVLAQWGFSEQEIAALEVDGALS
jgi:alpha-methylacyl-CoA racemase